jgi:tRNA(His) 5'-end guanylyltransferase
MPVHDDLGKRMKENYENVSKTRLVRRMPVAIRIDGKAFHTFTRGFERPFDWVLIKTMQGTTEYLCKNIQGCVFGYTQSDEITLILVDYNKLETSAWFDYEVQKLCSIAASMATMIFNKLFEKNVDTYVKKPDSSAVRANWYLAALNQGAMFDARCFNIPKEEVTNLIYWRQLDATRNSIQMVGQAHFSHKELQGLSCNEIQNKLLTEKGINWNNYPIVAKRGTAVRKGLKDWYIDPGMPILKGDLREYVDSLIYVGEE